MISYGDSPDTGPQTLKRGRKFTDRGVTSDKPRGHIGRLAAILDADNVAIINANLRVQVGVRVERFER